MNYKVEKNVNGNGSEIILRMSPDLARDVADAIDDGLDSRAVHAKAVNAVADALHEIAGED